MASLSKIGLIVEADEPALFFSSVEAAERYIEPIDARAGVYPIAYATDGTVYDITTVSDAVRIIPRRNEPPHYAELRAVLSKFLRQVDVHVENNESLASLLSKCERFVDE